MSIPVPPGVYVKSAVPVTEVPSKYKIAPVGPVKSNDPLAPVDP